MRVLFDFDLVGEGVSSSGRSCLVGNSGLSLHDRRCGMVVAKRNYQRRARMNGASLSLI